MPGYRKLPDVALARRRAPAARRTPPPRSRPALPAVLRSGLLLAKVRPAKAVMVTLLVVMLAGIAANAMLLQTGRHPAPLFGDRPRTALADPAPHAPGTPPEAPRGASAARDASGTAGTGRIDPESTPVKRPEVAALPPPRPADSIGQLLQGARAPAGAAGAREAAVHAPARPGPHGDALGDLIRGNVAAGPKGTADSPVMAAQRALVRLGYAVKADGTLGTATRDALAAFAKAHHLAGGTELTPKLLHELTSAANVSRH